MEKGNKRFIQYLQVTNSFGTHMLLEQGCTNLVYQVIVVTEVDYGSI